MTLEHPVSSGAEEEQVCSQQKGIFSLKGRDHPPTIQPHHCSNLSGSSPGATAHQLPHSPPVTPQPPFRAECHQVSSTTETLATAHKRPQSPTSKRNLGEGKSGRQRGSIILGCLCASSSYTRYRHSCPVCTDASSRAHRKHADMAK